MVPPRPGVSPRARARAALPIPASTATQPKGVRAQLYLTRPRNAPEVCLTHSLRRGPVEASLCRWRKSKPGLWERILSSQREHKARLRQRGYSTAIFQPETSLRPSVFTPGRRHASSRVSEEGRRASAEGCNRRCGTSTPSRPSRLIGGGAVPLAPTCVLRESATGAGRAVP